MSTESSKEAKQEYGPLVIDGISYIPSSVLLSGIPKLSFKDNRAFGVLDARGESPRAYDGRCELGIYYNDTRYLSMWEMTFNGAAPATLSHDLRFAGNTLVISMSNRDLLALDGRTRIPRDTFLIRRILTLVNDVLHELVIVRNFDHREHRLRVEQWMGSRFDDIFEVRGFTRNRRGRMLDPDDLEIAPAARVAPEGVNAAVRRLTTLRYRGLDGHLRSVHVHRGFAAERLRLTSTIAGHATWITIPAKGDAMLSTRVSFDSDADQVAAEGDVSTIDVVRIMELAASQGRDSPLLNTLQIRSDNEIVNRSVRNAAIDIQMLLTEEEQGVQYPYAGVPWFSAPFGRDGIITALQLLPWHSALARGVLDYAFQNLGSRDDPFTDSQPGKVFHEMRRGEMAVTREVPFIPYYGSVDATPLALILLHDYVNWTLDLTRLREWWPRAIRALDWMDRYGDSDADGFLEYQQRSPTGLPNQGWKDSTDSIMHADGRLAPSPIRLCEVQAYSFRARLGMSALARLLGETQQAEEWRLRALQLRARFHEHFWDAARGSVHLAIDGERRPCAVLSSNMGHCLWAGILSPEQADSVTSHLMSPAMFNGYGIRTLADTEHAYNPMSYHNGSVWPHDCSLILEGFRHYGKIDALERLAQALIGVLEASADFRLPELFCGFRRRGNEPPVPYEVACKPQAWAAGSLFLMLKSLLGLSLELDLPHLVARSPRLTSKIREIEIRGLRGREWELDLRFRRGASGLTAIDVLRKHGNIRVLQIR